MGVVPRNLREVATVFQSKFRMLKKFTGEVALSRFFTKYFIQIFCLQKFLLNTHILVY